MRSRLDDLILEAKKLAKADNCKMAITLANQLVKENPNEMKVWSLRGYLHARMGKYSLAAEDITQAIAINAMEPCLFHSRGRYLFSSGDSQAALDDFSRGLELCAHHGDDYYREDLHFWRAEVLIRLDRKKAAIVDLEQVSEDYTMWTTELRTKAALLALCRSSDRG